MAATELEGVILGIVSSRQPCSAYDVRLRFQRTSTWGWSKSKGAIYPAVARLVARGSLATRTVTVGGRNKDLLSVTEAGAGELAAWLLATTAEMGGAPVDPIRTRVNYLSVLSVEERMSFLDRAERATEEALAKAVSGGVDPEARDNWTLQAGRLGAITQIKAKLEWLRAVRALASTTP